MTPRTSSRGPGSPRLGAPLLALAFLASFLPGPASLEAGPLVHTYSVVARDPGTGELGVAVQSHWPGVGALCAWARPGVGVVVTQAKTEPSYGARGLRRLADGQSAPEVLEALLAADAEAEARQVALVDSRGRVAAHTGALTIPATGHQVGAGFSVQANMMRSERVVPAMARAFQESRGDLAERLVATLEAAQAAGGDLRGQQAAALVVVSGDPADHERGRVLLDLRVDDHPGAVAELRRLLRVRRGYDAGLAAGALVRQGRLEPALERFAEVSSLAPRAREPAFWFAFELARRGLWSRAVPRLAALLREDPAWEEVLRRLPGTSVMPRGESAAAFVEALLGRVRRYRGSSTPSGPAPPGPGGP